MFAYELLNALNSYNSISNMLKEKDYSQILKASAELLGITPSELEVAPMDG